MNRRVWLKVLAGGTAGLSVTGFPYKDPLLGLFPGKSTPAAAGATPEITHGTHSRTLSETISGDSYFGITDNPETLVRRLLELTGWSREQVHVSVRMVAPSAQDLALVRDGNVIDPTRNATIPSGLVRLATELRNRSSAGTRLVSIEPRRAIDGRVRFEFDGEIVETIDPAQSYKRIVIAGAQGDTVFRLSGGALSVTSSSCRHELCRSAGAVQAGRIICAPNRLVASIGNPYSAVDVITG